MSRHIVIATNQGDIGGGEVMLLNLAEAWRALAYSVSIIGPSQPSMLLDEAQTRGFDTISLAADSRRSYALALLRWRLNHLHIPLWCNGLLPALATTGLGPRVTHLHDLPRRTRRPAARVAALRSPIIVPSRFMGSQIAGSLVLENWTENIPRRNPAPSRDTITIGFMGRLTRKKGVDVLARAMRSLPASSQGNVSLVIAGENKFGDRHDDLTIRHALDAVDHQVIHRGWIPRDEFLQEVDLAVFPSVFPEPFGLVAAEAMAAGVPFVISDAGGLPEVAGPHHPWVARAGDAEHLAEVMWAAIQSSDDVRADVTNRSRSRWEDHYSPASGKGRVQEILASLPHLLGRQQPFSGKAAS